MKLPVALQLYTVRDQTEKDFVGTLKKVAGMGYSGVEFAGFGGLSSEEIGNVLDDLGLEVVGCHYGVGQLEEDLDGIIQFCGEIESPYVVCSYADYEGREDFEDRADVFEDAARKCSEAGLGFCYHNHAHEFEDLDGTYGLDLIYSRTDPALVQAELDTYWIKYAGLDPEEYLRKYAGRAPLVHLKDMEADSRDFAELGNGILDMEGLVKAASECGAEWLIVEQDVCKRPSLESAEISIKYLKSLQD